MQKRNLHDEHRHRFTSFPVDEDQAARIENLRQDCLALANKAGDCCPPGRALAIAITRLQEASMWMSRAISAPNLDEWLESLAPDSDTAKG